MVDINEAYLVQLRRMQPMLDSIITRTKGCSIPEDQKLFLSLCIASHFVGAATGFMPNQDGRRVSEMAEEVMQFVIETLKKREMKGLH